MAGFIMARLYAAAARAPAPAIMGLIRLFTRTALLADACMNRVSGRNNFFETGGTRKSPDTLTSLVYIEHGMVKWRNIRTS